MPELRLAHPSAPRILAIKKISPEVLKYEPWLVTQKAFNYRLMSATDATEDFYKEYLERYREYYRKLLPARGNKPFGSLKFAHLRDVDFTGLWKARQAADSFGISYSFYLACAFECLLIERKYRQFPRPNQLYHRKLVEHIAKEWEASPPDRDRIRYTPELMMDHGVRSFVHEDYHRYLLGRIRAKTGWHRHLFIADVCFHYRVLPVELVEAEFGPETVEKARREVSPSSIAPSTVADVAPVPSCWGLPGVQNPKEAPCNRCEFAYHCQLAGDKVRTTVSFVGETKDERVRRLNRQRQRRRRAKLTAGLQGTSCPPAELTL